ARSWCSRHARCCRRASCRKAPRVSPTRRCARSTSCLWAPASRSCTKQSPTTAARGRAPRSICAGVAACAWPQPRAAAPGGLQPGLAGPKRAMGQTPPAALSHQGRGQTAADRPDDNVRSSIERDTTRERYPGRRRATSVSGSPAPQARSAGGGARRSCRRRPASPPTRGVRGAGSLRPASTTTRTPARRGHLASRRSGGWAPCAGLVPAMEARTIPRVPGLAQARGAEVPVGANLTGNGAQVAPEVNDRWAPPEPVAVVDAVDDQAGLQNERVRDHRIVLRIGVLLDVEVLLDDAPRVGEEGPLRAE